MNVSLYELTDKYKQLSERLADIDLDVTTIADTIEASGLPDDIADKAQSIECIARNLEMYTPAIDSEIARLMALKLQRKNKAASLRLYLQNNMVACGIDKIESPLFKIKLQNNPESVDVFELGLVPSEYMTQPKLPESAPDKKAISKALKAGKDVQGCRLSQSQRLVVS